MECKRGPYNEVCRECEQCSVEKIQPFPASAGYTSEMKRAEEMRLLFRHEWVQKQPYIHNSLFWQKIREQQFDVKYPPFTA